MKKYISKIILLVAVALSFSAAANAQLRVRVRPSITIGVRPPQPSPRHVWVSGEWNSNGGQYAYREGYWEERKAHHSRYTEGRWSHSSHGYVWIPGRWR